MMSYEITQFSIAVPVTDEQWAVMMKWDDTGKSYDIICELEKLGAQRIEWNGHFGQNFYFTANADFETDELGRTNVNNIINHFGRLLNEHRREVPLE